MDQIKSSVLCKDIKHGGLRKAEVNAFIMPLKLKSMQRILDNNSFKGLYNLYINKY